MNKIVVSIISIALLAGGLCAQTRVDRGLSTPGSTRSLGSSGISNFQNNSYGRSGAFGPSGFGGSTLGSGDLLRSSIGDSGLPSSLGRTGSTGLGASQFGSSTHGGVGTAGSGPIDFSSAVAPARQATRLYTAQGTAVRADTGDYDVPRQMMGDASLSGLAGFYTKSSDGELEAAGVKAITTLVPKGDNMYTRRMATGEKAFRDGDYAVALTNFESANIISRDSESYLSMLHAEFASGNYAMAASNLRKALRLMPDLPKVNLQPKAFFSEGAIYMERYIRLSKYIQQRPMDADAQLVLAYLTWFDADRADHTQMARDALCRALALETQPEEVEPIETFWEAMRATGKVRGELKPLPAVASGSAAPAAKSAVSPAAPAAARPK